MTLACVSLVLCLLSVGCSHKGPDLSSPEALGRAYIDFINNGAQYTDYLAFIPTLEEAEHVFGELIPKFTREHGTLTPEQVADAKKEFLNTLKLHPLKENPEIPRGRPFRFVAFQSNQEAGESDNYVYAVDSAGREVKFRLSAIHKANRLWKIYSLSNRIRIRMEQVSDRDKIVGAWEWEDGTTSGYQGDNGMTWESSSGSVGQWYVEGQYIHSSEVFEIQKLSIDRLVLKRVRDGRTYVGTRIR